MLPRLEIPILGEQDISAALIKRPAGYDNNVITLKWTCDHSKTTVRKSVPRNSCLIWLDNLCARRGVHTLAWLLVSWVVSSYRWISAAIIGFCHLRSLSQSPHDVDDDRYDFALAREILANPLYRGERRKTIYFSLRNESTRSRSATLGWDFFFFKRWVFFATRRWNGMCAPKDGADGGAEKMKCLRCFLNARSRVIYELCNTSAAGWSCFLVFGGSINIKGDLERACPGTCIRTCWWASALICWMNALK